MAKYVNLGSMKTRKEKDERGRPQYYLELDKSVIGRLSIDGQPLSKFINVNRPTDKFERMLEKGAITEAEFDEKVAMFDKGGKAEFVKFELSVKLEG